jgi:hypothetical protein
MVSAPGGIGHSQTISGLVVISTSSSLCGACPYSTEHGSAPGHLRCACYFASFQQAFTHGIDEAHHMSERFSLNAPDETHGKEKADRVQVSNSCSPGSCASSKDLGAFSGRGSLF